MEADDVIPAFSAEIRDQKGESSSRQDPSQEFETFNAPARVKKRRLRQRTRLALEEWANIPSYLKDNEYIKKYYRVDYTLGQTLRSLFTLHNETFNVWTHLIGVMLFLALTIVTLSTKPAPVKLAEEHLSGLQTRLADGALNLWRYRKKVNSMFGDESGEIEQQLWIVGRQIESMLRSKGRNAGILALHEVQDRSKGFGESRLQELLTWYQWLIQYKSSKNLKAMETAILKGLVSMVDLQWPAKRWPVHVFTFGAMFCLATSTICHLFGSLGYKRIAHKIWKYDYAGIVVLIVASFVPVVYYSFLCSPMTQAFYLITSTILGFITVAFTLMPTFQHYKYRTYRACLFAGLGLWGIVPGIHAFLKFGSAPAMQKAFTLDILMGITYLAGASLYACRIPERWKPGAFDLVFNSHQIFHVAVVFAALLHYIGVRVLLKWRDTTGGCTIPFHDLMASQHLMNGSAL